MSMPHRPGSPAGCARSAPARRPSPLLTAACGALGAHGPAGGRGARIAGPAGRHARRNRRAHGSSRQLVRGGDAGPWPLDRTSPPATAPPVACDALVAHPGPDRGAVLHGGVAGEDRPARGRDGRDHPGRGRPRGRRGLQTRRRRDHRRLAGGRRRHVRQRRLPAARPPGQRRGRQLPLHDDRPRHLPRSDGAHPRQGDAARAARRSPPSSTSRASPRTTRTGSSTRRRCWRSPRRPAASSGVYTFVL